jgi:hypothetical protein
MAKVQTTTKTKTNEAVIQAAVKAVARPRPDAHWLIYGDFGSGKSTFLATFAKYELTRPVKIYMFDPAGGKEFPYLNVGTPLETQVDGFGIEYTDVVDDEGGLLIRVMHLAEVNPTKPESYLKFEQEFDAFSQSYKEDGWRTVGLDTIDSLELAARKMDQYVTNPGSKDPRKWWGGSTDKLEETLCMRLAHLRCNVVVLTHINRDKISVHGHAIQGPSSGPGRMDRALPGYFPEIYRSYVVKHEGERHWNLQTYPDEQFMAETHINAPDPSYPDWDSLWANW